MDAETSRSIYRSISIKNSNPHANKTGFEVGKTYFW